MTQKVRMALGTRGYDIQIGAGAIQKMGGWLRKSRSQRAFIVADQKLTQAREATRAVLAKSGWEVHEIPVGAGESLKDIEAVFPIYGELLKFKANRDSTLFALGGGSVGDAAGFVAATYLRGIEWVGIPTTLLAQVDSAIGGKTGINHTSGKNLIGSFHQPRLVVCDTHFLQTLSQRERISGLGEAVKYGITFDPVLFSTLEKGSEEFLQLEPKITEKIIHKSVRWKCKAVARDEYDRKGVREVLNFGHTFGHALESHTRYQLYQHGEAVIWGMRFALALSKVRKKIGARDAARIAKYLSSLDIPPLPRDFGPEQFIELMSRDKKVREGKIHFVLLKKLGQSVSDSQVKAADLVTAYREMV